MRRKKIIRIKNGEIEIKSDLDLDRFLESMRVATQRYFGIPEKKKIREFVKKMLIPVGYENDGRRKRRKKS